VCYLLCAANGVMNDDDSPSKMFQYVIHSKTAVQLMDVTKFEMKVKNVLNT